MARSDDHVAGNGSAGEEDRPARGGTRPATADRPATVAEARAAAEARRSERKAEREQRMAESFAGRLPGRGILASSAGATVLLAVVSAAALATGGAVEAFFVVTFSMFCLGALLLAVDVLLAAARSTRSSMGIGGIFFLVDAAPGRVQRWFNGSLGAAVAVAVVTAVAGLSTPELAFGTLAPLLQLSLTGLWGVRHGLFGDREVDPDGG